MSFDTGFAQGAQMVRSAQDHKLRQDTLAERQKMNAIAAREAKDNFRRMRKGREALMAFQEELDGVDWSAEDAASQYDDMVRRYSFTANMHPQTSKAFQAIHDATLQNRAMTDRRLAQSAQTAALGEIMRKYPDIGGNITAKMRKGEEIDWEDVYGRVEKRRENERQQEVDQYRARGEAYYGARAEAQEPAGYEPTAWDKAELSDLFSRRRELRSEISKLQITAGKSPDSKRLLDTFKQELEEVQSSIQGMQGRFVGGQAAPQMQPAQQGGGSGDMSGKDLQEALMQRFMKKYGDEAEQ